MKNLSNILVDSSRFRINRRLDINFRLLIRSGKSENNELHEPILLEVILPCILTPFIAIKDGFGSPDVAKLCKAFFWLNRLIFEIEDNFFNVSNRLAQSLHASF